MVHTWQDALAGATEVLLPKKVKTWLPYVSIIPLGCAVWVRTLRASFVYPSFSSAVHVDL